MAHLNESQFLEHKHNFYNSKHPGVDYVFKSIFSGNPDVDIKQDLKKSALHLSKTYNLPVDVGIKLSEAFTRYEMSGSFAEDTFEMLSPYISNADLWNQCNDEWESVYLAEDFEEYKEL